MSPRALTAALAIAGALGLGGCTAGQSSQDSTEDFRGEQRRVAQVVENLQEAAADGDGNEICQRILAEDLREAVSRASRQSCAEAVEDALGDVDADELQVERVRITDGTAIVRVRGEGGGDERTDTITLRRERGGWRIAQLG